MTQELTDDAKLKLLALDKEARVAPLFEGFGSDERDACSRRNPFRTTSIRTVRDHPSSLIGEEITATDPRAREHFQKQWESLAPAVQDRRQWQWHRERRRHHRLPTLVENVLTSTNMTLRGKLSSSLLNNNTDEANRLARSYGLHTFHDVFAHESRGRIEREGQRREQIGRSLGGTKHKKL